MSAIRSKNTGPELAVRSLLHALGYRYRLHVTSLPGKPDLVFPGRRKIVEVRGCYWHACACQGGRVSNARAGYWGPKIAGNVARDARNLAALRADGWEVLEVWECQIKKEQAAVTAQLSAFLGPARAG